MILFMSVLVLIVGYIAAYRITNQAPSDQLTLNRQVSKVLETGGCMMCHTPSAHLPFYASWPIADKLISQDVKMGMDVFDMTYLGLCLKNKELRPNEVDIAKLENVANSGTMPPIQYAAVHLGASLVPDESNVLLAWTKRNRIVYYTSPLSSKDMMNEPLQPITYLKVDSAKVQLGEDLFNDLRLSTDSTISCASCHGLKTGGVDNKQYSEGIRGQKGGVNAPSVYNAFFNFVQFWDGRAANLAEQAAQPPLNPVEMGCESFDEIIERLEADEEFSSRFKAVYPEGITELTITDAIAEYEKTLITPSRFDAYLRGDSSALSAEEIEGYELFKKFDCATCHVGKNIGGQSYEKFSLHGDYYSDRAYRVSDATLNVEDNGRYKQTGLDYDKNRFKVPSLRNVELTYPYMHDGTIQDLAEVVNKMVLYQTVKKIRFSDTDKIVKFLHALTGDSIATKNPAK